MAEALAIAASVIAVIQVTDRVIHFCKLYVEHVRDLPSDIRTILVELSTLKTVLENLKFLIDHDGITSPLLSGLGGSNGSIEGCRSLVAELEKLLDSENTAWARAKRNGKSKLSLAALKWPLKQTKAQKLLSRITHFKSTITLAITAETTVDIKEIKDKSKEIHSMLTAHQRHEVYRWLVLTDPSPLHETARKNFEPGTGDWMLRLPEWVKWLNTEVRFLWLHGIPGAGKTVLFSQLVEKTKEHCNSLQPNHYACVYYYCYFGRKQDETRPFLRWTLNQLCRQADWLSQGTCKLYETRSDPSTDDLLNALADIAGKFTKIYVLIDALDESSPREDLLKLLVTIKTQGRFGKIQLLATSRKYTDIESSLSEAAIPVSMSNPSIEGDIRLYVRATLQSNPKFRQRWSQDLLDEIESVLPASAEGMFRWAVCQIDLLERLKPDRQTIRRALGSLPKTLYDTYDRILSLIPEDDRLIAHHALQWIRYHSSVFPGRGIPCLILSQAVERSVALATNDENNRCCDFEALEEICGCLIRDEFASVKKTSGRGYVYRYRSVSFAHYTVLEYCNLAQTSNAPVGCPSPFRKNADLLLAETILLGAHTIKNDDALIDRENSFRRRPVSAIHETFLAYCIYPSLRLIRDGPVGVVDDPVLYHLTVSLMEPSEGGDNALKTAFKELSDSGYKLFDVDIQFFTDFYKSRCHGKQTQLLDIFLLNGQISPHRLLEKFLQKEEPDVLFGPKIVFENERHSSRHRNYGSPMCVESTVTEIIAKSGMLVLTEAFSAVIKHSTGHFDPSIVLFEILPRHDNLNCHTDTCLIDTLLKLGADPNLLQGYWLSPLQIAVSRADEQAVRKLLSANANANSGENVQDALRPDDVFFEGFKRIRGMRPLSICLDNLYIPDINAKRHPIMIAIRNLLIQYGAKTTDQSSNSDQP